MCKLLAGGPRLQSHIERKWIAIDHSLGRVLTPSQPVRSKRVAKLARMNAVQ
jgi:hypothetical protein